MGVQAHEGDVWHLVGPGADGMRISAADAAQDLARRGRGLHLSVPHFSLVVVQPTVCTDAQAIGLREALHTVAEGAVSPFVPALAAEAREHLLVGAMAAGVRGEAAVKARAGRLGFHHPRNIR